MSQSRAWSPESAAMSRSPTRSPDLAAMSESPTSSPESQQPTQPQESATMPPPTIQPQDVRILCATNPAALPLIVHIQMEGWTRKRGFIADDYAYASGLVAAPSKLKPNLKGERSEIWIATYYDRIVGMISVDGEGQDNGQKCARLTSFTVADEFRRLGIGRRLLDQALTFIDAAGLEETRLWILWGLDEVRAMFELVGFVLDQEVEGKERFGRKFWVQLFVRRGKDVEKAEDKRDSDTRVAM